MRGKNHPTKYEGKYQGECDKVEKEENLKNQSGDGEDLQVDVVADA